MSGAMLADASDALPAPTTLRSRAGVLRQTVSLPGDRTIAFAELGTGPDIVLIHGTLVTLEDMWLGLASALASEYHVVAVDRPGHGQSQRMRLVDASPWRQAELIHDAIVAMGLTRPVIVGHSAGGAVALAYGMSFPEDTAGIVALAPICFPEVRLEQVLFGPRSVPFLGELLAQGLHHFWDSLLLPLLWRAMFLPQAMPPHYAAEFPFQLAGRALQIIAEGEDAFALWPGLSESAARYFGCRTPVSILGGSADAVLNNRLHGFLAAQMIPRATFRMLPGVGHMLHHSCPDQVLASVREVT